MTTLRRLARTTGGAGFPHADQGLESGDFPFVKVSDFNHVGNERVITTCTNWVTKDTARRLGATVVTTGSVLLPKVGAALLGNARRIVSQPSVFDNNILGVIPKTISSRYLHYWLTTVDVAQFAKPGPVPSMGDSAILDLRVPVVSRSPQRAIADYLDIETGRIDALISKKRHMIELLQKRVSSVVFDGVTGRLTSPHARIVPSGIEWLGKVPEHFGTPWLGEFHTSHLGKMLNAAAASGPDQYPYIKNTNVQWDRFELEDLPTMNFDADDRRRYGLRPGDVLVCEGGEVGRSAVWNHQDQIYFQKALHCVRPLTENVPRFLMYCLWAAADLNVFAVEGNQATIVHLTGEKLRSHRFPWPPLDEQEQIVSLIDSERGRIDRATKVIETQIELLAERRQALVTAAVTGQLAIPRIAA